MIKVCHLTSVHSPEDVRIFKKECSSLANAGYDTYLVEQGESYDKNGVHIVGVGKQEKNRILRFLRMGKRVYNAALSIDADVYHFHDPELMKYGLKLKKKGKIVIFDSHENTALSILEKYYIPSPLRKIVYHFYKKYEKRSCNKLDAVIYVSPNMKDIFSKLNKETVCLPNFPIAEDNCIVPDLTSNKLVFAGVIMPTWSHDNIIKAIESIDNVSYTLCGYGSEAYMKELESLPGWSKVDYIGRIPHDQVAIKLSESFIGVALMQPHLNSMGKQGTLGNTKIFEEMMAGLPVLCTDFDLWKPIVEGNKCGLCVDPNNIEEIRSAIQYFLDNREEAAQMGKRGREAVLKTYNWAVEEKDLLSLYDRLINLRDKG